MQSTTATTTETVVLFGVPLEVEYCHYPCRRELEWEPEEPESWDILTVKSAGADAPDIAPLLFGLDFDRAEELIVTAISHNHDD